MRNILRKILVTVVLATYVLTGALPAFALGSSYTSASQFQGYATDTVAGFPAMIRTSQVEPDADIMVEVTKPDNSIIRLPSKATGEGYGAITFNEFHTQIAGTYKIGAYLPGKKEQITYTTFRVLADKPSMSHSELAADKLMLMADGNDTAYINVILRDKYSNPIKDHMIKLISSRTEDTIDTANKAKVTTEDGKVIFRVSSSKEGLATLSAVDLTLNEILDKRLSVVFQRSTNFSGGDALYTTQKQPTSFFGASLMQATTNTATADVSSNTSAAATLKLSSSSNQVGVGELFSVTVDIFTDKGLPALDYRGTILFSSDDPDAVLPGRNAGNQYTFTGTEQGRKSFSQTVTFTTPGVKTIRVKDTTKTTLQDAITVVAGNGPAPTDKITVSAPVPGTVLATKEILVAGQTTSFLKLKIFDNDIEVAQATADATGSFKLTVTNLTDGTHSILVRGYDQSDKAVTSSDPIQFTVRAAPAWVNKVTYFPTQESYTPGQEIRVTVESEPELKSAVFALEGVDYTLLADSVVPGSYTATVTTPSLPGSYTPNVRLTSKLGIASQIPVNQTLIVKDIAFDMSQVKYDLVDEKTVKVTWLRPTSVNTISGYRVSYGLSANDLSQNIVLDTTKDNVLITDLLGNTSYFFQFEVLGQNNISLKKGSVEQKNTPAKLEFSNAVAIPGLASLSLTWEVTGPKDAIVKYRVLYGVSPDAYTKEVFVSSAENKTMLSALVDQRVHYIRIQAFDKNEQVILQSSEISGSPLPKNGGAMGGCQPGDVSNLHVVLKDNKQYLKWNPVPDAERYIVHMGTTPGNYNLPSTPTAATIFELPVMNKEVAKYYFAVSAVCGESESMNLSNAVSVETGPALFFLFSLAGGAAAVVRRARKKNGIIT